MKIQTSFNRSPFVPMRWIGRFDHSKKAPTMAQNGAKMGLEGANGVGKGQDSGPTPQNANNSVTTPNTTPNPAFALELPSLDLGGGVNSAPVRLSLSPILPQQP